ncbi:MAG: twin-arginine translocation signal domain-containing protein [Adlercreutzia sp.]
MAMEEKSAGAMTRRGFLTALGLAGASAAGAGLVGCAPKQPTEAAGDDQTALADTGTLVETDIPEEKILETVDCDVCGRWRVWEPCVRC